MDRFQEFQKVQVTYSLCGYVGLAEVIGKAFGNKWLVKIPPEDSSSAPPVFTVEEQHLKIIENKQENKKEKKEEKNEVFKENPEILYAIERKTKRKNRREKVQHRPQGRRK